MDTTDYPSLPNLSRIHVRLAAESQRVEQITTSALTASGQADVFERLFQATTAEDWEAVSAAAHILAQLNPAEVGAEVIAEADKLYEELAATHHGVKKPKHLANLLVACRAVRSRMHR